LRRQDAFMPDAGSIPMSEPLAYFLTWTTYGTWLPGDARGWVKEGEGFRLPEWKIEHEARRKLAEAPCILDDAERKMVEDTIRQHCVVRGWTLLAVSCRTNHVHVVVNASASPDTVMSQFKAWCTRRLTEHANSKGAGKREKWWTEGGSTRFLNDEKSLDAAVSYVLEGQ
jgi:REP element-mobilizing transposase RayT